MKKGVILFSILVSFISLFLVGFVSAESCTCGWTPGGGGITFNNVANTCIPGPTSSRYTFLSNFIYSSDNSNLAGDVNNYGGSISSSCSNYSGCCNGKCFDLLTEKCCSDFYLLSGSIEPVGKPDGSGLICGKYQVCNDTSNPKDKKSNICSGSSYTPTPTPTPTPTTPDTKPCADERKGTIRVESNIFPASHNITSNEINNTKNKVIEELSARGFFNDGDGFVCPSDRCVRKKFFNGAFWPWENLEVPLNNGNTFSIYDIMKENPITLEGEDNPHIKLPLSKVGKLDVLPPASLPMSLDKDRKGEYQRLEAEADKIVATRASDWLDELKGQYGNLDSYKVIHSSNVSFAIMPYTLNNNSEITLQVTSADYKLELVKNKEKKLVVTLDHKKVCEDRI